MPEIEQIRLILEADKQARKISEEARRHSDTLEEDLKKEADVLRSSYFERAERRLDQVRKTENEYASSTIQLLNEQLNEQLNTIAEHAREHRQDMVDALFGRIVSSAD